MMQQKEARRKHTCMLPKKVVYLVWFSDSVLIGNDGCYLHASYYVLYGIEGSTQEARRKHAGSTQVAPIVSY